MGILPGKILGTMQSTWGFGTKAGDVFSEKRSIEVGKQVISNEEQNHKLMV